MGTNQGLQETAQDLKGDVKKIVRTTTMSPFVETLERLGYIVRGLVYSVIGVLALQAAIGGGGALTDPQGAIATLGKTPVGGILLYVILIGLLGYGLWGLVRAIADPLHKGSDTKGTFARIGYAISGFSYLLLGFVTYNLINGNTPGSSTQQLQQTIGSILAKPWGVWVVGFVALCVIGAGISQIVQGLEATFNRLFKSYMLSASQLRWITRLGRFGYVARGFVFTLIGVFLGLAAYHNDPAQAKGIDAVLASLRNGPYGFVLLGIVALGLIGFGIFSIMCGFWLRLRR